MLWNEVKNRVETAENTIDRTIRMASRSIHR